MVKEEELEEFEEFEKDYYLLQWTNDDLIKAQNDLRILLKLYHNDKRITDLGFLEAVQGFKSSFQDFYENFDLLIDETYPK
jgi:hypothetical protein